MTLWFYEHGRKTWIYNIALTCYNYDLNTQAKVRVQPTKLVPWLFAGHYGHERGSDCTGNGWTMATCHAFVPGPGDPQRSTEDFLHRAVWISIFHIWKKPSSFGTNFQNWIANSTAVWNIFCYVLSRKCDDDPQFRAELWVAQPHTSYHP